MKKLSIILALTLVLVVAFAASAYADYTNFGTYNITANGVTTGQSTNWGGGASSIPTTGTTTRGTLHINPLNGQWGSTTNPSAVYLPGDPSQQPIHSNYQANTDACSACHAVHTGNGDALTQWNTAGLAGITNVCMACHDGTVTKTYNVVAGTFTAADGTTGNHNNGGLFAVTYGQNTSASQHNVFDGLLTSAAFGGSNPGDIVNDKHGTGTSDQTGNWNVNFDCTACHTPHGQGANARILDPNPNYVQTKGYAPDGHNTAIQALYTKTETTTPTASYSSYTMGGRPILGYPYNFKLQVGAATLKQYVDYTLSLDPASGNAVITFKNAQAAGSTLTIGYVPALVVRMNVANKLTTTEKVTYQTGLNDWCGACHTDYNTKAITQSTNDSAAVANGKYSSHTRHAVGYTWGYGGSQATQEARGLHFEYPTSGVNAGKAVVNCLTCHFGHGVDKSIWAVTATKSGITAYNTNELAGSSRLKRLPNMGVCEACHEKGNGGYSGDFNPQTAFTQPATAY